MSTELPILRISKQKMNEFDLLGVQQQPRDAIALYEWTEKDSEYNVEI